MTVHERFSNSSEGAVEWNLDPKRFAATGRSAGAGIAEWIAFHDDMARPITTSGDRIKAWITSSRWDLSIPICQQLQERADWNSTQPSANMEGVAVGAYPSGI